MSEQARLFDIPEPQVCLSDYDWILVNSSAGKDSLAMLDVLVTQAEAEDCKDSILVVHCDLGRVEWPGTRELAKQQAARYGVNFVAVRRAQGDLLEQVEARGMWPSPRQRYCQKADALLIAAAPELFAALKIARDTLEVAIRAGLNEGLFTPKQIEDVLSKHTVMRQIDAAIAKATQEGETVG